MLQEIIVLVIVGIVLFFVGRSLVRMLRPRREDKRSSGCSGCPGCGH
ncbi:FeoB-associated Cys-rich membrane protein [Porphyromonas catoniae]|nr:FeoB-associated Cys-rich membrane protein [Porphyromonas catoniae]